MDNDLKAQRYSVLGQTWAHHNLTQLQWPAIITGVILVGLTTLVSSTSAMDCLVQPALWGNTLRHRVLGLPFFLAAVMTLLMIRTMRRAQRIMKEIEVELDALDGKLGVPREKHFSMLNHSKGRSGPGILAAILSSLAFLIGSLGLCLIVGWKCLAFPGIFFSYWALYEFLHVCKTYHLDPMGLHKHDE